MSDPLKQELHLARLTTPLGDDKLALVSFECNEGLNEKFEVRLRALSKEADLNFDTAIGQSCTVTVEMFKGQQRYFDGVLAEARWLGGDQNEHQYELVLRPWLWLAAFRRNCLIFHNQTVDDIVRQVLSAYGTVKSNLSGSYPELEYCVQYRESDMDFACRLMEEYGINYYFEHASGSHTLVLANEMSTFTTLPHGSRPYSAKKTQRMANVEHFDDWVPERRFTSGKVKLDDYDFENSSTDLALTEEISPPFEPGDLEVFDYPGRYVKQGDGHKIAQAWRDAERARDGRFLANGVCVSCFPGSLVTLDDKDDGSFSGEYLALRSVHRMGGQAYRSAGGGDEPIYEGRYEFIKTEKTFAPDRVTPKAIVHGPQTAVVVGDGEIDVDEYGRILVRFHWDQKEDQSRRCRVAQVWAGKQWGGLYIPRVGMEVVVAFLEGDPDQPLVVGAVYNDKHMPPYDLPNEKTVSGVKSESTPGGGGYNEFAFDDDVGHELVRLHAQRDLESVIERDESRKVGNDRKTEIGQNDDLDVGQVLTIKAGTKVEITVGGSKITMTPEKIAIQALQVEITATDLKTSALTANHSAAGVMNINGALVKIN